MGQFSPKGVEGYLLEHKYTETNLHFRNLKGRDRRVVEFLRGLCDDNKRPLLTVYLLLIEKHEMCGVPSDEDPYSGFYNGCHENCNEECDRYDPNVNENW